MAAPVLIKTAPNPLRMHKINPSAPKNSNNDTGFPFDDTDFEERDRGRSFRSHIDDIVKRHPELAEHLTLDGNLDRFPFRSNTWGNKRRGSASSGDESRPSGSTEQPENRRFGRPFGSRFEERFGFPFSRTFDGEPEYYSQQRGEPQPQTKSQPQPQPKQPPQPQQSEEKAAEKPPQVPNNERGRKQNQNIQQSNTVDLGQKQDPVQDPRGQRSMSAPPENRAGQQRYVSSINIPIHGEGGGDANPQQTPPQASPKQQQQHAPQQSRSNERVIPIHVEGRDEPVLPKQGSQTFTPPPPQPERVFGQRPSGFGGPSWGRSESPYYTADPQFYAASEPPFFPGEQQYFEGGPQFFTNRGEPQQQRANADQYFNSPGAYRQQQQQQPQYQQQQQPQYQKPQQKPQAPPQQQAAPQQQAPPPQQHAPPPPQQQVPPPPPSAKPGPIDQIQCIQKDVLALMTQVEQFNGKPKDKQYVYLDEMLTRNLLKLDDVETEGKDNIRQARKEAINCIQRCISILEAKAAANELLRSQLMDVDTKIETLPEEAAPLTALEVSGVSRSGTESAVNPTGSEQSENTESATPMEVGASAENAGPEAPQAEVKPADAEVQNTDAESEASKPDSSAQIKVEEQPIQETKEEISTDAANSSEQTAQDSTNASQDTEAKEEAKDKKEKKKVKKKEKTSDKGDKAEKK